MHVPTSFQEKIINCFGEAGENWLETLEGNLTGIAENWGLTLESPVTNLSYNYVLHVTTPNNIPYILKIGLPGFDFSNEIRTLQLYNGQGCARLVRADEERGAMLLENLQPGKMLCTEIDEEAVIRIFCQVWKQIRRPLPNDREFPTILHWASVFERYEGQYPANDGPIPHAWIQMAVRYLQEVQETTENELLHGDLHHENILYSNERGWLAIDPKGVAGSPYCDVVSFMINHLFTKPDPEALLKLRAEMISEHLQLNREKLLKAAISMSTLYACWGLEDNDPDWQQTYQCAKWFKDLLDNEFRLHL